MASVTSGQPTPARLRQHNRREDATLADGATTLWEELYTLSVNGHKLGGYPTFTQSDPRGEDDDDLVLLFQLDSDPSMEVMWGDVGTASFFIRNGDLARRDFSQVAY